MVTARARRILVAAGILTPAALLFWRVLWAGEALFSRDITFFFYPMKAFLAESVRSGTVPLWNPWILNGEPFYGSLQPGLLYPPSVLLYLLPLHVSFDWLLVLHYPVAGLGTYLLLRRWGHGRPASLLGSIGFVLGGYYVSVGNFLNNLQTVAWIPWLFLSWDRFLASGRVREALWFSAVAAVAFLGGEPQMLGLGLAVLFLHGVLSVEKRETAVSRQAIVFGGSGLLASGLVAVQLLPFVRYVRRSVRTFDIPMEFAAGTSLEPTGLVSLLLPPALEAGIHDFTTQYMFVSGVPWLLSLYPGAIVGAFALAAAVAPRGRRWLLFWTGCAGVGVLLALGQHGLLYPPLYESFPLLRPFRYPEKFVFLTALALAVLSAGGMDGWLAARRREQTTLVAGLVGLTLLYGTAAAVLGRAGGVGERLCSTLPQLRLCSDPNVAQELYAGIAATIALLLLGAALLAWGRRREWISPRTAAVAVLLLASADLWLAHKAVNPSVEESIYTERPWAARVLEERAPDPEAYRYRGSPLTAAMGQAAKVRRAMELSNMYLIYQSLGPNLGSLYGRLTQDGSQGVELQSVARTFNFALQNSGPVGVNLLRATNVRHYADATGAADSLPGLIPVATHPELPIRIWEVPDPVPRAYLVTDYRVDPDPVTAFAAAITPGFRLHTEVVLDRVPPLEPDGGARGRIVAADYGTNHVGLRTETTGTMILVLTDRNYPGWEVTIDGEETELLRGNDVFRAVAVPGGRHEVVFRFAPSLVRVGGWISLCTLGVWLAGLVALPRGGRT